SVASRAERAGNARLRLGRGRRNQRSYGTDRRRHTKVARWNVEVQGRSRDDRRRWPADQQDPDNPLQQDGLPDASALDQGSVVVSRRVEREKRAPGDGLSLAVREDDSQLAAGGGVRARA